MKTINLQKQMLTKVAEALGEQLIQEVVFVGGCTTGLLITDDFTKEQIRYTDDVDLIVDVVGYPAWTSLQDQLRVELKLDSKLLDIAAAVEEAALNDDYFKQRGLYPNIDFYSGVILTALRIPTAMFTPIFVIGRTPGWLAQWSELKLDPTAKIARPRQLYTGK